MKEGSKHFNTKKTIHILKTFHPNAITIWNIYLYSCFQENFETVKTEFALGYKNVGSSQIETKSFKTQFSYTLSKLKSVLEIFWKTTLHYFLVGEFGWVTPSCFVPGCIYLK